MFYSFTYNDYTGKHMKLLYINANTEIFKTSS